MLMRKAWSGKQRKGHRQPRARYNGNHDICKTHARPHGGVFAVWRFRVKFEFQLMLKFGATSGSGAESGDMFGAGLAFLRSRARNV